MKPEGTSNYALQAVGEGVYAALSRPTGSAICNSGLVDLGDVKAVFDTGLTPAAGRDLRTLSIRALGQPPGLAVSSHWHLDHTLGNQAFAQIPVWSTRRTREVFLEMQEGLKSQITKEALERELRDLEARRPAARTKESQEDLELFLQIHRSLLAAHGEIRFIPPSDTFETRLKLPGARPAELVSFSAGHTAADALLLLPREKILFAGDVVLAGPQPSMPSGDPRHWIEVLDEVDRLGVERIVPGHGPVSGADATHTMRSYLSAILEAAELPEGRSLPAALRRWEGSYSFDENLRFVREWVGRQTAGR